MMWLDTHFQRIVGGLCSDDLVKVDFQIESLVKRIDRQYRVS